MGMFKFIFIFVFFIRLKNSWARFFIFYIFLLTFLRGFFYFPLLNLSEIRVIYQLDFISVWLILLTVWLSVIMCLVSQKIFHDINYIIRFLYIVLFLCVNLVNTFLVSNIFNYVKLSFIDKNICYNIKTIL